MLSDNPMLTRPAPANQTQISPKIIRTRFRIAYGKCLLCPNRGRKWQTQLAAWYQSYQFLPSLCLLVEHARLLAQSGKEEGRRAWHQRRQRQEKDQMRGGMEAGRRRAPCAHRSY